MMRHLFFNTDFGLEIIDERIRADSELYLDMGAGDKEPRVEHCKTACDDDEEDRLEPLIQNFVGSMAGRSMGEKLLASDFHALADVFTTEESQLWLYED